MGVLPCNAPIRTTKRTLQLIVTEIFSAVTKSVDLTEESSLLLFEINLFPFLFPFIAF